MKAALKDEMYFRPLAFDYPKDTHAANVEDQLMVGESIMIAPVYTQNAKGRYVYLPERMLMVRMKSLEDRYYEVLEKGHHYLDVSLNELVIFVKKDHLLPLAVLPKEVRSTLDAESGTYEWIGYTDESAEYVFYHDDGITKEYTKEEAWEKVVRTKEECDLYLN
jgi:alpha-glucosidase